MSLDLHAILLAQTDRIWRVAMARWRREISVRIVLGEPWDVFQTAVVYILHYGLRYYDSAEVDLDTYIGRMAYNGIGHALQRWRRSRGRSVVLPTVAVPEVGADDPGPGAVLDRLDVAAALGVVTKREAEVLALRYGLDGSGVERTYAEIGEALGITRGTVNATITHALARLRRNFKVCEE